MCWFSTPPPPAKPQNKENENEMILLQHVGLTNTRVSEDFSRTQTLARGRDGDVIVMTALRLCTPEHGTR